MCFFGARFRVPSYHVDQSHLYAFFHPASGRNQCAKFRGWETRVLQTDPPSCLYFTYLRNGALSTDIPLGPAETDSRGLFDQPVKICDKVRWYGWCGVDPLLGFP